MRAAIVMYPLFENAIRGARGRALDEHQRHIGTLMARFAAVAAANPLATRRQGYSAEQLVTVNDSQPLDRLPVPEADERACLHRPVGRAW